MAMSLLRPAPGGSSLLVLPVLVLCLLGATLALPAEPEARDLPPSAQLITDESRELGGQQLHDSISELSDQIGGFVEQELGELANELAQRQQKRARSNRKRSPASSKRGQINEQELERFREAKSKVAENTRARIDQAGKQNSGELQQSLGSGAYGLLSQVNGRLSQASSFIGSQLSSLGALAPKIRGQASGLAKAVVPARLRELMQWPSFWAYKIKHNKSYKSLREEIYRQMVFLQTQARVGVANLKYLLGRARHLLKATQYADMSDQEYSEALNNQLAEEEAPKAKLSAQDKARMQAMADKQRDYAGNPVPQPEVPAKAPAAPARKRRDVSEPDYDDELSADDEDSDSDMMDLDGPALQADGGQPAAGADDSMLVDRYAHQFDDDLDGGQLDDLDTIMDDALADELEEPSKAASSFQRIDLRDTGCIIKPENQYMCGNCFSQVTNAAASYYNCLEKGKAKTKRYNARFTSDCGRYLFAEGEPVRIKGCNGGLVSQAIEFTRHAGVQKFAFYEVARASLERNSAECAYPKPATIDKWAPTEVGHFAKARFMSMELDEIDLHLRTMGPVFVNARVWADFKDQGSGILDTQVDSKCSTIHSMLIVGHDRDESGKEFFVVWNSHGTNWGDNGFVRISRESLEYFHVLFAGLIATDDVE